LRISQSDPASSREGPTPGSQPTYDPTHRFTGQELDPETELYYYGGRYYDYQISRFISPDPFVQSIYDPQNLNRYSYVVNNPQNYIDPDGYFHQFKKKKKGGFFKRFFSIFSIVIGIITLQPELAALGVAAEAVHITNILVGLGSLASGMQGLATELNDSNGVRPGHFAIDGASL
jgi:RHS repeat-associated protein